MTADLDIFVLQPETSADELIKVLAFHLYDKDTKEYADW